MKTIFKRASAVFAASLLLLTACGKEEEVPVDWDTIEIQQNDYMGGIKRTLSLKESVLKVMEDMRVNNKVLREDSPNSFWTADGYQDFVSTFLDANIINDTKGFNEERADWEATVGVIGSSKNSFTSYSDGSYRLKGDVNIRRNEKDDYSVSNVKLTLSFLVNSSLKSLSGNADYRILYDCDKDWCKAYATMKADGSLPQVTADMFEYQRVNNDTFAIQTSRERFLVILDPVETDTDIRQRTIKGFYYSKLVQEGQRTTYTPYEPLPEKDENDKKLSANVIKNETMDSYPYMNDKGDFAVRYGEHDSMFYLSPQEMTTDWVFEDKALQQGIVYENGILVVTTYNKLSTDYERFVYTKIDADTSKSEALENLVVIKDLVGVQEHKAVVTPKTVTEQDSSKPDSSEAPLEAPSETSAAAENTEPVPVSSENDNDEIKPVPTVPENMSAEADLSKVIINNTEVDIANVTLQNVLDDTGIKHCFYGTTSLMASDFDFVSGMFGIQENENDISSFGGTSVSIEVVDANGAIVEPADLNKSLFGEYRVKGVHSSLFFTRDDFEVIYYGGIKCGMPEADVLEILGEGEANGRKHFYSNGKQTLVIEFDWEDNELVVDEISLINN